MKAPFPWFGGKRTIAPMVWRRFGRPVQFIEPFLGSAAILLAAPATASLEVAGDLNGFVANFWRAISHQPDEVAGWADYPVSHIDLGARHAWLMAQIDRVGDGLRDATWPGDAQVAGWWLWGQCCWIGSGWCEPGRKIPHVSDAGMGVQAAGKIPHVSDAGRGWARALAARLKRVRLIHGDWTRCLNHHYGADSTAVFLDPPYRSFEGLYGAGARMPVADEVAEWARQHPTLRVALCGHSGDYDLPGWDVVPWERERNTYGGDSTKDAECVWFSPGCLPAVNVQPSLFGEVA